MDATRALLDELMGKERDKPLHARSNRKLSYSDRDVCKYALAGACPYVLLRNTRSDIGECECSVHEDHLEWEGVKAQWDALDERERERYGYEADLHRLLEQLVRDMDRRIERNKERAAAESRPKPVKPEDQARLDDLAARVKASLDESMAAGEAGDVDRSMALAAQAEALKAQHEELQKRLTAPDRAMAVCEVCGIFILSLDIGRALTAGELRAREEHLSGRQYIGWKRLRELYEELNKKRGGRPPLGGGGGGGGGGGYYGRDHRERSRSRGPEEGERRRSRSRSPGGRRGERGGYRDHRDYGYHHHDRRRDYYDRDRDRDHRRYDHRGGGGGGDYGGRRY